VRARVFVAPLPVQPLAVAEADAGTLKGDVLAFGGAERLPVVLLGLVGRAKQGPARSPDLDKPRWQFAGHVGEHCLYQIARLRAIFGAPRRLREIKQPGRSFAVVHRSPVCRDEPEQMAVRLLIPAIYQRGHAHRVIGPRSQRRS